MEKLNTEFLLENHEVRYLAKNQPGTFGMRNGKVYKKGTYRFNAKHTKKTSAEREANKLRRQGYIATIKKNKKGYSSYVGLHK